MSGDLIKAVPRRLRLMPIKGDNMTPTLKIGDWVLVAPTDAFRGEGLYVFDILGAPCVYRCSSDLRGGIDATSDNHRYQGWSLCVEAFRAKVLGKVAAIVDVIDRSALGEVC